MALTNRPNLRPNRFLLFREHFRTLKIPDFRNHRALHKCSPFIILDVSHPYRSIKRNFFCESLFLEISDCVVIGIGEKVHYIRGGFDVVFKMGHEVGAVAFHLLVRGDCAKDDFGELAAFEGAIGDPTESAKVSNVFPFQPVSTSDTPSDWAIIEDVPQHL